MPWLKIRWRCAARADCVRSRGPSGLVIPWLHNVIGRLLKKSHLRRSASSLVIQRTRSTPHSSGSCLTCIWSFLNSLQLPVLLAVRCACTLTDLAINMAVTSGQAATCKKYYYAGPSTARTTCGRSWKRASTPGHRDVRLPGTKIHRCPCCRARIGRRSRFYRRNRRAFSSDSRPLLPGPCRPRHRARPRQEPNRLAANLRGPSRREPDKNSGDPHRRRARDFRTDLRSGGETGRPAAVTVLRLSSTHSVEDGSARPSYEVTNKSLTQRCRFT
jgi:hypothetical protein